MTPPKYKATGFVPSSCIAGIGLLHIDQAVDNISKGDVVSANAAGFATNDDLTTTLSVAFLGIAAADSDNSLGDAGDIKCPIIPAKADQRFWVACGTTLIAQTDVGETVILATNNTLNPGTLATDDWGFLIEDFDVSTGAIAAVTQGFARGRFVRATT